MATNPQWRIVQHGDQSKMAVISQKDKDYAQITYTEAKYLTGNLNPAWYLRVYYIWGDYNSFLAALPWMTNSVSDSTQSLIVPHL